MGSGLGSSHLAFEVAGEMSIAEQIRVGIIEDDLAVVEYLKRAFEGIEAPRTEFTISVQSTIDSKEVERWVLSDQIDVYIVDLNLPISAINSSVDASVGKGIVRMIHNRSTAGIIVYTSESLDDGATELLHIGADDFVRKSEVATEFGNRINGMQSYLLSKVLSVWRRVRPSRPQIRSQMGHYDRAFRVGDWKFSTKSQWVEGSSGREKLSATEHAVLRHLCISEDHSISKEEFSAFVMGEFPDNDDVKLKNIIYKVRQKMQLTNEIVNSEGAYRLISVGEMAK